MPRPKKTKPNRSDGLYEVKITTGKRLNGSLIRKSFYSSISKEDARHQAEQWRIDQEVSQQVGTVFVDKHITFQDWASRWLSTYKRGKVKDNTYRGTYEYPVVKIIIPYFGSCQLTDVRSVSVQDFFNTIGKVHSLETLKKVRSCLFSIFDTAIENDLCYKNPVTKSLRLTSDVAAPKKNFYSQAEYDVVMAFARKHTCGLDIMVLLETGMSRSELLGLQWVDIDFAEQVIYIRRGLVEQKSTDSETWVLLSSGLKNAYRERVVPISPQLAASLNDKIKAISGGAEGIPAHLLDTPVFCAPKGGVQSPQNWYKRRYSKFMEDMHAKHSDIPILSPHELRHTRATLWKDSGVDLFSIAKLLGHADLDMLAKRYAHNNVDTLKKALGYGP